MKWRACVLSSLQKPDRWAEVEAGSLRELLEKIEGHEDAFRILIYRKEAR